MSVIQYGAETNVLGQSNLTREFDTVDINRGQIPALRYLLAICCGIPGINRFDFVLVAQAENAYFAGPL